ncbi:surface protein [Desulfocucumis palustris]|uniref:Surface protein n=2 Tax=Desulfocucumis palustris TaxID=1898651 RepID=A0A2L2XD62_9FIRM|nr:surface protein [Desulfocucumis palustris]
MLRKILALACILAIFFPCHSFADEAGENSLFIYITYVKGKEEVKIKLDKTYAIDNNTTVFGTPEDVKKYRPDIKPEQEYRDGQWRYLGFTADGFPYTNDLFPDDPGIHLPHNERKYIKEPWNTRNPNTGDRYCPDNSIELPREMWEYVLKQVPQNMPSYMLTYPSCCDYWYVQGTPWLEGLGGMEGTLREFHEGKNWYETFRVNFKDPNPPDPHPDFGVPAISPGTDQAVPGQEYTARINLTQEDGNFKDLPPVHVVVQLNNQTIKEQDMQIEDLKQVVVQWTAPPGAASVTLFSKINGGIAGPHPINEDNRYSNNENSKSIPVLQDGGSGGTVPQPPPPPPYIGSQANLIAQSVQVTQAGIPVDEIESEGDYKIRATFKIVNLPEKAKGKPAQIQWWLDAGDGFEGKGTSHFFLTGDDTITYESWSWDGSEAFDAGEVDIAATINLTDAYGAWQKIVDPDIGEEETYDDNVTLATITAREEPEKYQGGLNHTIGAFEAGAGYLDHVEVTWTQVNIPPPAPLPKAKVRAILWPSSRDGGYRSRSDMQASRSASGLYLKTEDINGITVQGVWIRTAINGKTEEVFAQCNDNGVFTGVGYIRQVTVLQEAVGEKSTKVIYPKAANGWRTLSGRMDGGIYGEMNEEKKRKKTWVNYKSEDKTILVEMVNNNRFPTTSKIMVDNWGNKLTTTAEFKGGQKLYAKVDNFLETGGDDGWQHINVLTGVTGFNAPGGPAWMLNVSSANGQGYHKEGKETQGGWLNPFECHSEEEGYFIIPRYAEPELASKCEVSGPAPYYDSDYDHYLKQTTQGQLTISRLAFKNYFMPGIFLKPCFVPKYKFMPVGDNPNLGTVEEAGVEPGYALVRGEIPPPGSCAVNEAGDMVFTNNTNWPEDVEVTVKAAFTVSDVEKGEFTYDTRELKDEFGNPRETVKTYEQTFRKTVPAGEAQTMGNMGSLMDWVGKNYPGTKEERISNREYEYYRITGPLEIKITFNKIAVKVSPDYVGEIPIAPAPKLGSLGCREGNNLYSGFDDLNVAFAHNRIKDLIDERQFIFKEAFANLKADYTEKDFSKLDKSNLCPALVPANIDYIYRLSY